jgi:protein-tyrosine phosphatase
MSKRVKVLFVCLGNICRSPMAEGLFLHKIKEQRLEAFFEVDSAGTGGWHIGSPADSRMQEVAAKKGVELPSRARKVKLEDLQEFDYILAMDGENKRDLEELGEELQSYSGRILKMREFDELDKGADVPDPYYGGRKGFDQVYEMLDRSAGKLLEYLRQENGI